MRRRGAALAGVAISCAACTVFVDTKGLSGGGPAGPSDGGAGESGVFDGSSEGGRDGGIVLPPPTVWSLAPVSGERPSGRRCPRMIYDDARSVTVLFGGAPDNDGPSSETWEWSGSSWARRTFASTPGGRQGFGFAYDTGRYRGVAFGGQGANASEIWELAPNDWSRRTADDAPDRLAGFSMVYDSSRRNIIGFGGHDTRSTLATTWVIDGTTGRRLSPPSSPPATRGHRLAFDEARGRVVLFGGIRGEDLTNDTFTFDGTTWTKVSDDGPSKRVGGCMAYDSDRRLVILFGGRDAANKHLDDTWLWDGATWKQAAIRGPSARRTCAMAYDRARQTMVLFGGASQRGGNERIGLDDVWLLR